jgi:hypothetical protein
MSVAEKLIAIQAHLAAEGNKVQVATHLRATLYDHRHASMFRVSGTDLQVQRGRAWDCIASDRVHLNVAIRYGREVAS